MNKLCVNCNYVGREKKDRVSGSLGMEILIWGTAFTFGVLGIATFVLLIPAFILFIIGIFYSLSRYTGQKTVCPKCELPDMIPADSPKAVKVIEENKLEVPMDPKINLTTEILGNWTLWGILVILAVVVYGLISAR